MGTATLCCLESRKMPKFYNPDRNQPIIKNLDMKANDMFSYFPNKSEPFSGDS